MSTNTQTITIAIKFDDDTKEALQRATEAFERASDQITKYTDSRGADGLLKMLQAEAANDRQPIDDIDDGDYLDKRQDFESQVLARAFMVDGVFAKAIAKKRDEIINVNFVKSLSDVLIDRMYKLDRFSDDEHEIRGNSIKQWDIVAGATYHEFDDVSFKDEIEYAVVVKVGQKGDELHQLLQILRLCPNQENGIDEGAVTYVFLNTNNTFRTIRANELPQFYAAMEAAHA